MKKVPGPWVPGPGPISPWSLKSLGPWGRGLEVQGTLGPRPLMCQGLKVRGPMGQGHMALESEDKRPNANMK